LLKSNFGRICLKLSVRGRMGMGTGFSGNGWGWISSSRGWMGMGKNCRPHAAL